MKYIIIGYLELSSEVLQSEADSLEKAQKHAGYMLEVKTCYKVEIKKKNE